MRNRPRNFTDRGEPLGLHEGTLRMTQVPNRTSAVDRASGLARDANDQVRLLLGEGAPKAFGPTRRIPSSSPL